MKSNMKIDAETGRIAYHAIRFVEGGTDLVQYDFGGKIESITPHTRYAFPAYITNKP